VHRLFYLNLNIIHILCFVCLSTPKYKTLYAHQHTENKLKIIEDSRFSYIFGIVVQTKDLKYIKILDFISCFFCLLYKGFIIVIIVLFLHAMQFELHYFLNNSFYLK